MDQNNNIDPFFKLKKKDKVVVTGSSKIKKKKETLRLSVAIILNSYSYKGKSHLECKNRNIVLRSLPNGMQTLVKSELSFSIRFIYS